MKRGADYIGIDLAWGERQRRASPVLDAEGLVHVSSVARTRRSARRSRRTSTALPVGIDAPLIVTDPTGSRSPSRS